MPASHHHELGGDATRLFEKPNAVFLDEVAVEVAREDAIERAVRKGERERITLHERSLGQTTARLREHACALVEPDDIAVEMLRQEPRPARDIERAHGRERCDRRQRLLELGLPAGPLACRADPPVVVIRRAQVVVLLHPLVE